jgi:CheY-like chemotaxis protein
MDAQTAKRKQVLLVDDEASFLSGAREIFGALSKGSWDIHTALNHAQALAHLEKHRVDLIVLDIGMPVVDGIQFLRLLNRAHPGQQVVILTGQGTEAKRQECLANGALLFLEKPVGSGGYEAIFAAIDPLATAPSAQGFRGVMRQVGLQEVLQMECLGMKSSILEIFTGKVRGRIFICDGAVIHADQGTLQGEVALYSLLALRGGEFNLRPFTEPPQRTIQGQWEFLLMEAARLQDEKAQEAGAAPEPVAFPQPPEPSTPALEPRAAAAFASAPAPHPDEIRIQEIVLCSGTGEVLHDRHCKAIERRVELLEQVSQLASQFNSIAPLGRFDRLEIHGSGGRTVCLVHPDRRLFVRSTGGDE